ncbi:MAG: tRNA (adenosine(37)-N6)-threonylcarbamoyltransferase complex dimerization subunit type 1 TsaB [Thiothrix sp.]|nr:MAG: tRNA (adenosine(37)-N6)-threonylcarbamoyltransferase complex dimerization subunit type 1 TsaB [Thiothrix sp.]
MPLLALDTSSDACSAAVLTSEACFTEFELTPRAHTQLILPMVESVLKQADLELVQVDAIAFGRGPGAFTGVRIATGVAQGLALAANKKLLPISSLAALAQQAYQQQQAQKILVALDARMGEVYWGIFQVVDGQVKLQGEEQVLSPAAIDLPTEKGWIAVGSGWAAYPELLARASDLVLASYADWLPSAEFIAQLAWQDYQAGRAVAAEQAQPIYLRNKIAQTTQERLALKTS